MSSWRSFACVCVADELCEQPRRLAEASAGTMDEPDVAMERVMPEVDRAHCRGPAAKGGGLRHQRDPHAIGHEPHDRVQFVHLANLLHAQVRGAQEAIDLPAAE